MEKALDFQISLVMIWAKLDLHYDHLLGAL
jgi:hypothetical protein